MSTTRSIANPAPETIRRHARFIAPRRLRFSHCDPSGIAYFPAYLDLLNGVVEDFWKALGFPWSTLIGELGFGTPTVRILCEFSQPSRLEDELSFAVAIERLGRSSLALRHEVSCGEARRWRAEQTLVLTRLDDGRPAPWPQPIREALERFNAATDIHGTDA